MTLRNEPGLRLRAGCEQTEGGLLALGCLGSAFPRRESRLLPWPLTKNRCPGEDAWLCMAPVRAIPPQKKKKQTGMLVPRRCWQHPLFYYYFLEGFLCANSLLRRVRNAAGQLFIPCHRPPSNCIQRSRFPGLVADGQRWRDLPHTGRGFLGGSWGSYTPRTGVYPPTRHPLILHF